MAKAGPQFNVDSLLEPVATFCCAYKVPLITLAATSVAAFTVWKVAEGFDLLPDMSDMSDIWDRRKPHRSRSR